jgi:hypothetical protein
MACTIGSKRWSAYGSICAGNEYPVNMEKNAANKLRFFCQTTVCKAHIPIKTVTDDDANDLRDVDDDHLPPSKAPVTPPNQNTNIPSEPFDPTGSTITTHGDDGGLSPSVDAVPVDEGEVGVSTTTPNANLPPSAGKGGKMSMYMMIFMALAMLALYYYS